jgi:hypothetical protein
MNTENIQIMQRHLTPDELKRRSEAVTHLKIGDLLIDNFEATIVFTAELYKHRGVQRVTVGVTEEIHSPSPQGTIIYMGRCKCAECQRPTWAKGGKDTFHTFMWSDGDVEKLFTMEAFHARLVMGYMSVNSAPVEK